MVAHDKERFRALLAGLREREGLALAIRDELFRCEEMGWRHISDVNGLAARLADAAREFARGLARVAAEHELRLRDDPTVVAIVMLGLEKAAGKPSFPGDDEGTESEENDE